MFGIDPLILNFAVAIGIGLLIGAERERRKGEGPTRSPAGIRTFTITALAGAVSITLGGELLLTVAASGVILLASIAYWRAQDDDPGLTTEIALILTMLIGGLAMRQPSLALASPSFWPLCWPPGLSFTVSFAWSSLKTKSQTP
jgi:MgtC family